MTKARQEKPVRRDKEGRTVFATAEARADAGPDLAEWRYDNEQLQM